MHINIPVFSMLRDPDYWEDPLAFKPGKVKGHTLLTISEIFVFFTQIYADNKAVPHYIYSNGSPPVFVRY